ncbi:helix-turn-helix transcriptional regulator [Clostridium sp. ZBS20]|uniref:helix-turn-helix domain-containing protein n=1 Tax=Clostridium sp. ZBS20 TaxID=2949966 RepID=UPI001DB03CF3|nr:helix-turn-helix transcriptional regulator [Clostridium sp. ZBS20]HBJ1646727.1 helix-turn-helix transcriptional regulator [Clostridium botulinum]
MDIGTELKELRKKSGLTQQELAKKCSLSKNAIWNYENNKRNPTINTLNKIGNVLGVDLGYLLASIPKINHETAESLNNLGIGSEIIKAANCDITDSLIIFNKFLASANLPFDIPEEELEVLFKKTKDFLGFEFFKLGYIKVGDIDTNL